MEQARRLDELAGRETAPMQKPQFRAQIVDLCTQSVTIGLIDPLSHQLRQQCLRFVEGGRELGELAGAARGSRNEVMVHGISA